MKTYIRLIISATISLFLICLNLTVKAQEKKAHPPFMTPEEMWADSVMASLSPRERIGQLIAVAAYSNRGPSHAYEISKLIDDYGIGGLIFFQGGPERQAKLHNHYQKISRVPLMISMDAEWGLGMRLDSTISFPYQMTLGAIQDNKLIYEMGKEIAHHFKLLGMHVNFAPVVDINNNPANPVIGFRSFGEDKEEVTQKALAYMKGMQENGILATAKHFPGHGDTGTDSHYDLPVIKHSRERLEQTELYPFKTLIEEGLGATMVAHLNIPSLDPTPNLASTLSKPIVTDLLKEELNFKGIIFTDALNMKGVTKYYKPGIVDVKAILAGNDGLLYSEDVPAAVREIEKAINSGQITQGEIDIRCRKILAAKAWGNRFVPIKAQTKNLFAELNSPKAKLLNEKLFAAALTVLKNEQEILPIKDLNTQKIATVSITNRKTPTTFQKTLGKYTKVDHYWLSPKATFEQVEALKSKLSTYSSTIIGMHQLSGRPGNRLGVNNRVRDFISKVADKEGSIIAVFRNPYTLDLFPGIDKASGLIMAYQGGKEAESKAAQLIFGGIGANGKLPVTVNSQFSFGDGLVVKGGTRMGYTIPESVGWDSKVLNKKIDSIAHFGINKRAFPGCQIVVVKDQQVIFEKAYGYHTYDSLRKVDMDDLYDYASVTKITGPLPGLMKLHGEGKFKLDVPFKNYWKDFAKFGKSELLVRDILAHQAGLKAWIAYWTTTIKKEEPYRKFKGKTFRSWPSEEYSIKITDNLYQHKDYKKKQIYKQIKKSEVNEDPEYVYSGLTFYLYPEIIKNLSGMDYETYSKENFYKKIGAHTITYNPWKDYPLSRIVPTERDTFFRMKQIHGRVHDEGAVMMGGVSGNAGLFSTANDLAKLMQMYMNMGNFGGEQLIAEASVKEFTSYQLKEKDNHRGLGFDKPLFKDFERGYVAPDASPESFGHSGYTGTFTWADPKHNLLLVFFSNRVYPTRLNRKLYQLNIRPSLHQVLYDQIKSQELSLNSSRK